MSEELKEREADRQSGVSRRGFLQGMALGAAAAVPAEGLVGAPAEPAAPAPEDPVGPGAVPITLKVDGEAVRMKVEPRVTLLDALRDHTKLGSVQHVDITGAKRVCDRASCGACTMTVDGRVVYGCSMLAIEAQGKEIRTVEGLADGDSLHAVQDAFVQTDGLMCGFCTPGFIMSAKAVLDENPKASKDEITRALDGNICRCGTQSRVLEAVLLAASKKGGR